jgi:hypothetical protein
MTLFKRSFLPFLLAVAAFSLSGCHTGEVSFEDVQKNAADLHKESLKDPGTGGYRN